MQFLKNTRILLTTHPHSHLPMGEIAGDLRMLLSGVVMAVLDDEAFIMVDIGEQVNGFFLNKSK